VSLVAVDSAGGSAIRHLTVNASNPNNTANNAKFNAGDITFGGAVTLATNGNASASGGTISVTSSGSIATSGTGTIGLTATQNIAMASGALVQSANGNITLSANRQASPASGTFIGIDVESAVVKATGTGRVSLSGQGGTGGAAQYGVFINGAGALVQAARPAA